jgi:hypothetical protein
MSMRFSGESIDSKDDLDEDSQERDQDQSDNLEERNSREVSSEEVDDLEDEFEEESDYAEIEPEESNDMRFDSQEDLQNGGSKSIEPEISDYEPSSSYQSQEYRGDGREMNNYTSEDVSRISKVAEEVPDSEMKFGWWGGSGEASHIAAAVMIVVLIASLVLTFYTKIVPEFVGALVSSILIVTLIIYGAATLLKA